MAEDRRVKGVLITVAGVLVSTPDGLLLRLIASDEWTVLFWRGLLSGLAIFAGLAAVHGRRLPAQILGIGRAGLWAAVFFSAGTVLFVVSITSTTVANALFIVNTAPFFAATIAWLWFNEAVPARTRGAIACALFGVGVIRRGQRRAGRRLAARRRGGGRRGDLGGSDLLAGPRGPDAQHGAGDGHCRVHHRPGGHSPVRDPRGCAGRRDLHGSHGPRRRAARIQPDGAGAAAIFRCPRSAFCC